MWDLFIQFFAQHVLKYIFQQIVEPAINAECDKLKMCNVKWKLYS